MDNERSNLAEVRAASSEVDASAVDQHHPMGTSEATTAADPSDMSVSDSNVDNEREMPPLQVGASTVGAEVLVMDAATHTTAEVATQSAAEIFVGMQTEAPIPAPNLDASGQMEHASVEPAVGDHVDASDAPGAPAADIDLELEEMVPQPIFYEPGHEIQVEGGAVNFPNGMAPNTPPDAVMIPPIPPMPPTPQLQLLPASADFEAITLPPPLLPL